MNKNQIISQINKNYAIVQKYSLFVLHFLFNICVTLCTWNTTTPASILYRLTFSPSYYCCGCPSSYNTRIMNCFVFCFLVCFFLPLSLSPSPSLFPLSRCTNDISAFNAIDVPLRPEIFLPDTVAGVSIVFFFLITLHAFQHVHNISTKSRKKKENATEIIAPQLESIIYWFECKSCSLNQSQHLRLFDTFNEEEIEKKNRF